jgi:hypothetical protein
MALEGLGTAYVKLGQLLSSRPDLLRDVHIEELGRLVDDAPPGEGAAAEELEVHLRDELNFEEEAFNTELIRRLAEDAESIVVPQVLRPHVGERVLVRERIPGEKVSPAHGLAPERAASRRASSSASHPAGDARRRLPRRPAPRERAADAGRPAGARRRPARAARRRRATLALLLLRAGDADRVLHALEARTPGEL